MWIICGKGWRMYTYITCYIEFRSIHLRNLALFIVLGYGAVFV